VKVRGAILDGPVLHRRRDDIGDLGIKRLAPVDGPEEALEDFLGQPLAHYSTGKHIGAEDFVNAFGTFAHGILLIWARSSEGGSNHEGSKPTDDGPARPPRPIEILWERRYVAACRPLPPP
jgi:hypothetical protein